MAHEGRHGNRISAALAGAAALALIAMMPGGVMAAVANKLTAHVEGIRNDGEIPPEYAFCVPSEQGHTKSGATTNPAIRSSKGPAGQMAGNYGGYAGARPPWNDERLRHDHFIVYVRDVPGLGLAGDFGGTEAQAAIVEHAFAEGEVVGTYTQNRALVKKSKPAKKTS